MQIFKERRNCGGSTVINKVDSEAVLALKQVVPMSQTQQASLALEHPFVAI